MNAQLIYVVGPSGAGKDSLLIWLRQHLPSDLPIHWARRTIDRPCIPDSEMHESVNTLEFNWLLDAQKLAMHWDANEHKYGIRNAELRPLAQQHWVFLNGSRAHLPHATHLYPGLTVLHITADIEVLRHRLLRRGRESHAAIENRLQRAVEWTAPPGCRLIEIHNNDSLESSGKNLLNALYALENWPSFQV
jgi:ribose 1,5-bisphosphokinase